MAIADYQARLAEEGLSEKLIAERVAEFDAIRGGKASIVSPAVEKMTGRQPRFFETFVKDHATDFVDALIIDAILPISPRPDGKHRPRCSKALTLGTVSDDGHAVSFFARPRALGAADPRQAWIRAEDETMATERYNAREAETRWQRAWNEAKVFETKNDDPRPKYYVLEMFPYPSGRIHMGHVRNYTMGDVVARYKRAKGFNVLHPMGWDAFGMPAENAAMKGHVHPKTWTYENIATMRGQLKSMGLSLDWSREFATCDEDYYTQQQKLFLDFMKAGLVDRKKSKVNWDPVDMTVLANEQVIDGRGWRSGALVEQRELTQWFLKISDYSDELLSALDTLDRWPEKVRTMQKNWIGRSEGLRGPVRDRWGGGGRRTDDRGIHPRVRTTLFGMSFVALSADHPVAKALADQDPARRSLLRGMPAHGNLGGGARDQRRRRVWRQVCRSSILSTARAIRSTSPTSC